MILSSFLNLRCTIFIIASSNTTENLLWMKKALVGCVIYADGDKWVKSSLKTPVRTFSGRCLIMDLAWRSGIAALMTRKIKPVGCHIFKRC